ncbi:hypothetical protein HZA55_06270 [Candidatus Poribacteria bacterium]|nr:hypothetical protein [Candidatus Poribacteria bacterium]
MLSSAIYARNYMVTYEAKAKTKNAVEFEYWMDYIIKDKNNSDLNIMKHSYELEYGAAEKLKLSVYADMYDYPDKYTRFTTYRFEAIYSFFKPGEKFIDSALYFEYKLPASKKDSDVFESKILLTKSFSKLSSSLNFKFFEKELSSDSKVEFGYTWGIRYPVKETVNIGIEMKGDLGDENDFGIKSGQKHYLFPGVYIKLNPNFKINLSTGFGLTKESDDLSIKSLMQYDF